METTDKRIVYIDYFRCAGIVLMVMGHIGFGGRFDTFIHAFHMPMFFVCSGMCYKQGCGEGGKDRLRYMGRKAYKLLVPYFFFGIGHYVLWLMLNYRYNNYLSPLNHLLWDNTEGMPYAGALWFLTAFYFAQIIYYLIDMLLAKKVVKNIIVILVAVLGCVSDIILPFKLPWALSAALTGVGLLHMGRLFRTFEITSYFGKSYVKEIITLMAGGDAVTCLIFLNGSVNMRAGNYQCIPLFWLNATGSCIIGLYMAWAVEKFIGSNEKYKGIDGYIRTVGEKSIVYVCLNQIVILVLQRIFRNIDVSVYGISKLGWHLCLLFLTLAVLYFAGWIIFKNDKMRCMAGAGYDAGILRRFFVGCIVILCLILAVMHTKHEEYKTTEKDMVEEVRPIAANIVCGGGDEVISQQNVSNDSIRIVRILESNINYMLNSHLSDVTQYAFETSTNIQQLTGMTLYEKRTVDDAINGIEAWKNGGKLNLPNVAGGENAVRPWAHTCYVLASCLKFKICDLGSIGLSEMELEGMTVELIAELADKHCANHYGGWGNCWQSALWSENVSYAAWLLWDRLPESVQMDVVNMLVYEADRLLDYEIPYYRNKAGDIVYKGDTKGEENAWNSRILALASCMLPEHVHAGEWEQKMNELLLAAVAAPDDVKSTDKIGGYTLNEILGGSNIEMDGTVVNHNLYHLDYSTVIVEGMLDTVIIYTLAGRQVPETAFFNYDRLYGALVNIDLGEYDAQKRGHHFYERTEDGAAGTKVNMPGENDWGGSWYASYFLMDTAAELFHADKECQEGLKAEDWAQQHLYMAEVQVMGERDNKVKGHYFAEGENYFVSGETYMMQNTCKAYILRMLY